MYRRFNSQKNFRGGRAAPTTASFEVVRAVNASRILKTSRISAPLAVYIPQNKIEDLAISDLLKKNILSRYKDLTPIQDQTIKASLGGQDIIGIANTGTGKTAAFLIPLVNKVFKDRSQKVLIITPTRELALQIDDELHLFSRGMGILSALCVGGMSSYQQKRGLRMNPNFVIGTPGRIKDFIGQRVLFLGQFKSVVLDETDRMVDTGFINDIKYFISLLPKPRQSLFFSATVSGRVSEIIKTFVTNPLTVSVKERDVVENIDQNLIKVLDKGKKIEQLHDLLNKEGFIKVLIFGRTKWGVEKLSIELVKRGFKAGAIHGNKRQSQRQRTLDQFKRNEITILLATDVASRGLDINDVSHVINYDVPTSYDDYVHRIGRTGRAGKLGTAFTFVD